METVIISLIVLYAGFIIIKSATGWDESNNYVSKWPEDQKPGNIRVVEVQPTSVLAEFIYEQDWFSRTLFPSRKGEMKTNA